MKKTSHDSEKPAHGQQVITACAFIVREEAGKPLLFLPRRAKTKKFLPDVFELPGGHIDFGEDIEIGLKREIKEEFGMDIRLGDPFAAFTYINEIKGSHSIEVIYFAEFTDPIDQIRLDPDDHSTYVWAKEERIPELFGGKKTIEDVEARKILRGFELYSRQGNQTV